MAKARHRPSTTRSVLAGIVVSFLAYHDVSFVLLRKGRPLPFVLPIVDAAIIINEIMNNPAAPVTDETGEWFELYNSGDVPVNVKDWMLLGSANEETFTISKALVIPAKGYVVLAASNNVGVGSNSNVTVHYVYGNLAFPLTNTADDAIVLLNSVGDEQDRVEYTGTTSNNDPDIPPFPNNEGSSMSLKQTSLDNSVGTNWCKSVNTLYAPSNHGTPGSANVCLGVVPATPTATTPSAPKPTTPKAAPVAVPKPSAATPVAKDAPIVASAPKAPVVASSPVQAPASSNGNSNSSGPCRNSINIKCKRFGFGRSGSVMVRNILGFCIKRCKVSGSIPSGWKCGRAC